MQVKSTGFQTDFMIASFDGEIIHRPHYVVVRTPASPTFWWGNFILFDHAPREADYEPWITAFFEEIGGLPGIRHMNVAWESSEGAADGIGPFVANGFSLTRNVFMVSPVGLPTMDLPFPLEIRPIAADSEWKLALEIQHRCLEGPDDTPGFRRFQSDQMVRYRKMAASGLGFWLGAFREGQLLAGMGIFGNQGVSRCQAVATDPQFRRRGVASAMVTHARFLAQSRLAAKTIVIMTGEDHPARGVYEKIGFRTIEWAASLACSK